MRGSRHKYKASNKKALLKLRHIMRVWCTFGVLLTRTLHTPNQDFNYICGRIYQRFYHNDIQMHYILSF